MSVLANIQATKDKVIHLLKRKAEYKDDDEKLVAAFWFNEVRDKYKNDTKAMTAYDFLDLYSRGGLTSADVITRARRKAQEENKELRGKKWAERQHEEKEVRQHIND